MSCVLKDEQEFSSCRSTRKTIEVTKGHGVFGEWQAIHMGGALTSPESGGGKNKWQLWLKMEDTVSMSRAWHKKLITLYPVGNKKPAETFKLSSNPPATT